MTDGHNRTESEPEQIACSLPADDLQRRLREWSELGSEALITESTEGNVKTTVWRRRGDVAVRLKNLVDAERRCCSFLGFDLEESEDEIRLKITFPPEAEGMLTLDLH